MNHNPKPSLLRIFAAIFYDGLLLTALLFLATALVLPFADNDAFTTESYLYRCYLLLIIMTFFTYFWTHGGQTLGMRAWKIQLIQAKEEMPITAKQALLRLSCAVISLGFVGLGFFWRYFNPEKMTWHDKFSRTTIILLPKK